MTFFVVWTQGAYTWNIDIIESTKAGANKHKRDLVKDFGYESGEVKITEVKDERVAYTAQELSVDHENWSLAKCLKMAESE